MCTSCIQIYYVWACLSTRADLIKHSRSAPPLLLPCSASNLMLLQRCSKVTLSLEPQWEHCIWLHVVPAFIYDSVPALRTPKTSHTHTNTYTWAEPSPIRKRPHFWKCPHVALKNCYSGPRHVASSHRQHDINANIPTWSNTRGKNICMIIEECHQQTRSAVWRNDRAHSLIPVCQ